MFKNLKIRTLISLGFAVVLLMMLGLGLFASFQMSRVNDASTEISTNWLPSVRAVQELNNSISDYRTAEVQHASAVNPEEKLRFDKALRDNMANFKKAQGTYAKLISSNEEGALYDELLKTVQTYMALDEQVQQLSRQMKNDQALALVNGESDKVYAQLSEQMQKLIDLNVKGSHQASADGDALYASARLLIFGVIAFSLAFGIATAVLIVRTLMKQLGGEPAYVAEITRQVAQGNIDINVKT